MMKRILSGMRPTGKLHLGHLVGALTNWRKLQEEYQSLFMVADWHALMSEYAQEFKVKDFIFECVADWVSCGIDPRKSIIFVQSEVKEHLELYMALSTITPLSWLERCPTYKEQLREQKGRDLATYGFLGYPVLQAADILLYKADYVPIGEDQLAHLELAREILRRFHFFYKKKIFPEPQPLLTQTPKLLGLDNRKMSKTYGNFIALSDSKKIICQKVQQMFTDPKRIKLSQPGHPSVCNVFSYYQIFKSDACKEVETLCKTAKRGCTECKQILGDVLVESLADIKKRRDALVEDKASLEKIIKEGSDKAREIASATIRDVKKLAGLI